MVMYYASQLLVRTDHTHITLLLLWSFVNKYWSNNILVLVYCIGATLVLLCYLMLSTVHTLAIVSNASCAAVHDGHYGHQHVRGHLLVASLLHQTVVVLSAVVVSSLVCVHVGLAQAVWLAVV